MMRLLFAGLLILGGIYFFNNINSDPTTSNSDSKLFSKPDSIKNNGDKMDEKVLKAEEEWKKELDPEEYRVLREKGTERAFTGKFWDHFENGVYKCAGCGTELFKSETKFESGCGWPSYFEPIDSNRIIYKEDRSFGMVRTEVMCAKCGGHLGHVFDDGPKPTGLRYCINSVSLDFEKEDSTKK